MYLLHSQINLIYQFWIHTQAVDRLPAWLEAWLNTPSHHRVHHGRNVRVRLGVLAACASANTHIHHISLRR